MMKNEFESDLRNNERFLSSSENKAWKKKIIRSSHICIHTFSYLILKKAKKQKKFRSSSFIIAWRWRDIEFNGG